MKQVLLATALLATLLLGCSGQPPVTTSPARYSQYELEYRLLAEYPGVFWNDPDVYPVARPGQELQNALLQFVSIRANDVEFSAILEHLDLDRKDSYTDEEKLLIYRQHKLLTLAVQMTRLESGTYRFVLRVGEGQGERLEGTITAAGKINVEKREPSFNTHPICLTEGTLIATPLGPIPVEAVRTGMLVWTTDMSGRRVAAPVLDTRAVYVSESYRALSLTLDDGRTITASPGHPSSEGKRLDQYRIGDLLDGNTIVRMELVSYAGHQTYDLLPASATGVYWANGIRLKSTITSR
jgi:Hint domain